MEIPLNELQKIGLCTYNQFTFGNHKSAIDNRLDIHYHDPANVSVIQTPPGSSINFLSTELLR
jgi:hypothetical protein